MTSLSSLFLLRAGSTLSHCFMAASTRYLVVPLRGGSPLGGGGIWCVAELSVKPTNVDSFCTVPGRPTRTTLTLMDASPLQRSAALGVAAQQTDGVDLICQDNDAGKVRLHQAVALDNNPIVFV